TKFRLKKEMVIPRNYFLPALSLEAQERMVPLLIYCVSVTLGVSTLITVHQPPFVITVLGNDVIMPCHISSDDTLSPPVLYWEYPDRTKLWPPSEKFKQRVDRVDENKQSLNKSIILKNVQWVDSGNYLCKLSVLTAETKIPYRTKGNETRLIIYGKKKKNGCCMVVVFF
uniref:Ig-like domain-containing protein n=1 Tax=Takifugu rubripes TaxID=31033 RepID=A0A674PAP2_TAKRU